MFENILERSFFDNPVKSYLVVIGAILLVLIIKSVISKYLAGLLAKLISRKDRPFNTDRFQNLVLRPIEYFLVVVTVVLAFGSLNYPEVLNFKIYRTQFFSILECLSNSAMIISFIWLCIRLLEYVAEVLHEKAQLTHDRSDDQLIIFFKDFFKVVIVVVGILLVIRFGFGKSIGNLLTGLSIVGAAIALAFRESMENLIASFIIFFDKPFTIGDLVKVQNVTGTIERIGLRSTRLRTTDKTYVTVPNKQMVDTILDNQSLRTQRKTETKLELGLASTTAQIKDFVNRANGILKKENVTDSAVFLSDTGLQSHVVSIEYFTNIELSVKDFQQLRQTINLELIDALAEVTVDLAGNKREIVINNNTSS